MFEILKSEYSLSCFDILFKGYSYANTTFPQIRFYSLYEFRYLLEIFLAPHFFSASGPPCFLFPQNHLLTLWNDGYSLNKAVFKRIIALGYTNLVWGSMRKSVWTTMLIYLQINFIYCEYKSTFIYAKLCLLNIYA